MARASTMPKLDNRIPLELDRVDPVSRELVALIRRTRREQKITQWQLAAATGVSTSNICQLEMGYFNLSVPRLVAIGKALSVDPAWLLATAMQALANEESQ